MRIQNVTPFTVAPFPGRVHPPSPSMTIVVKGTFRLEPGKPAVAAPAQIPPTGDIFREEDPEKLLLYPSDFAHFKPKADVLLNGTCHPPAGQATAVLRATFRVGGWSKSLAVMGDRVIQKQLFGSAQASPQRFARMEVSFERAYGGPGYAKNPIGIGLLSERDAKGEEMHRFPNVERPDQRVMSREDRPEPDSFGPIPMSWPQRRSKAGTYDAKWQKERWPGFPADFDWSFYNAAADDQQIAGYLKGNEEITLEHFHPKHPHYTARLPGLRVRCFLREAVEKSARFREVPTHLDTLIVDANTEYLVLVWRAVADVRSERFEEILDLVIASEPLGNHPLPIDRYEKRPAVAKEEPEPIPPPPSPPQPVPVAVAETDPPEPPELAQLEERLRALVPRVATPALPKLVHEIPSPLEESAPEPPPPPTPISLQERIARRDRFQAEDLTGADLAGLDLSGLAFPECLLTGASLANSILHGTDFSGAVLSQADLRGADAVGAILRGANLSSAVLAGANLSGSDLREAIFVSTNLREAKLSSAQAAQSTFEHADLQGADLSQATLEGAKILGCSLEGADFTKAKLQGASIFKCWGRKVRWEAADISGARWNFSVLTDAGFRKAHGPDSIWEGAALFRSDFSSARLNRAEFSGSFLESSSFADADLQHARFCGGNLRRAKMTRVNLFQANLEKADLTGADFQLSNLYEAEFLDSLRDGAQFAGANVKRTKLE